MNSGRISKRNNSRFSFFVFFFLLILCTSFNLTECTMRDKLFQDLLQRKSITLSEFARNYLGVKYLPTIEPMIISTFSMDPRFHVKEGRIRITKEAEAASFDLPFIVLDTETTGFSYYDNNVIEIAAMKIQDSRIVDQFHTLINPGKKIPSDASAVHGITDEMVSESPMFSEVMGSFLDFLGNGVFVAHNVMFDWNFMNAEIQRHGGAKLPNQKMCTIELTKTIVPGLPTYKLKYLVEHFGTKAQNEHRALADVSATVEIMLSLLPKATKAQLRRLIK